MYSDPYCPQGRLWISDACAPQQLREVVGLQDRYEYLLHDRDSIFANHLDESIGRLGVKVLKSPPHSPMANAICERVIGTIRRECLGLADSAISIASTIHSEIVGPPLQYRAPAHGVGSRCPRSATGNADQSPLKITPSLLRRGCRARQLRAGWATPRVFLGATDYFTEYLR